MEKCSPLQNAGQRWRESKSDSENERVAHGAKYATISSIHATIFDASIFAGHLHCSIRIRCWNASTSTPKLKNTTPSKCSSESAVPTRFIHILFFFGCCRFEYNSFAWCSFIVLFVSSSLLFNVFIQIYMVHNILCVILFAFIWVMFCAFFPSFFLFLSLLCHCLSVYACSHSTTDFFNYFIWKK